MKRITLNRKLTLAAITLATLATPALVHAQNYQTAGSVYNDCKRSDKNNQLLGGLLGAVAGGVIGSQISGRGERTEGSVIGAVIGTAAGAGIGDDNRNCTTEVRRISGQSYSANTVTSAPNYNSGVVSDGTSYGSGSTYSTAPYSDTDTQQPYISGSSATAYRPAPRYNQTSRQLTGRTVYTSPRYVSPTYTSQTASPVRYAGTTTTYARNYNDRNYDSYNSVHTHSDHRRQSLSNIKYRLDRLRAERRLLEDQCRYDPSPRLERRIEDIGYEIDRLKDKRRRLKRKRRAQY